MSSFGVILFKRVKYANYWAFEISGAVCSTLVFLGLISYTTSPSSGISCKTSSNHFSGSRLQMFTSFVLRSFFSSPFLSYSSSLPISSVSNSSPIKVSKSSVLSSSSSRLTVSNGLIASSSISFDEKFFRFLLSWVWISFILISYAQTLLKFLKSLIFLISFYLNSSSRSSTNF